MEHFFQWGFAQEGVLENVRSGAMERREDWLGGQRFPFKVSRSVFWSEVKLAKAELENWD